MNILYFQHRGVNTRDIFTDIIEGYRAAGHNGSVIELGPLADARDACTGRADGEAFTTKLCEEVVALIERERIDLCMCMWANAPVLLGDHGGRNLFDHIGVPVIMHWLDAPQWAHGGKAIDLPTWVLNGPRTFHYINNPGTAQEMTGILGYSNVIPAGNAAAPTSFAPRDGVTQEFDIIFGIGADDTKPTTTMLRELERDEPDVQAIRADMAGSIRTDLIDIAAPCWNGSVSVADCIDNILEVRLRDRHVPVLTQLSVIAHEEACIAKGILALMKDVRRYVAFSMKLRQIESWERAFTFVYLARFFKCATFGFKPSFQAWPGAWDHLGETAYTDQSLAYNRARFGLNVMRWQDDVGLNLKPYEITLSGTCLLQAYRVGIEDHFDDNEAVVFHTPSDCRKRVSDLLSQPRRIEQMAVAGRARSMAGNCWKHRAETVTQFLAEAFGQAGVFEQTKVCAQPNLSTTA